MTSTLIMVIACGVALAFLSIGIVLAIALLWSGRRVGDVATVRADLDTLRTMHRNLDEIFTSYTKRDAQRESTASKRAKKIEQEETPAAPQIASRDDIVRVFLNDTRAG